jgi:hypothetical protein
MGRCGMVSPTPKPVISTETSLGSLGGTGLGPGGSAEEEGGCRP